ncbi:HPF/RaiA family ribosome-associated protein [Coralloluteibacterium stylophorae]|uniref:HPF/RaiA family ribosome-associated protein n=1 Tax=Coralloluteibacterium stylophorae TaxID=1776034 RepID=A0A8J7VUY3_9GAMM|nr:HPF/RaiA family ribosome-associated protein [Coralloluteibacterium stylophorae]MBS7457503.1 HPF/RaiA family ribosome-associated protein [Coralloluteibacterium stylophorae]
MQVQTNTDSNIQGRESIAEHVEQVLESTLARFRDRITRVEVHLSDVNAGKGGDDDKKAVMEVRPAGAAPTVVSATAGNLRDAIKGAAAKLVSALEHSLGKQSNHHRGPPAPSDPVADVGDEDVGIDAPR